MLVIEDGSGVPGANSIVSVQEAATFHAERGGLIPVLDITSSAITFAPGGAITAAEGAFAAVPEKSIIEVRGAATEANNGFGHLTSAASGQLVARWLETVDEAPGAAIRITVYDKSGWWHEAAARLEASLINGTSFAMKRYTWPGLPLVDDPPQALPWPRRDVLVGEGSAYPAWSYLPDGVIPEGLKRAVLWFSLADLDAPLEAVVDPQDYLKSKTVGVAGITKVFGGQIRPRRFRHADAEVAGLTLAAAYSGPYRAIEVV